MIQKTDLSEVVLELSQLKTAIHLLDASVSRIIQLETQLTGVSSDQSRVDSKFHQIRLLLDNQNTNIHKMHIETLVLIGQMMELLNHVKGDLNHLHHRLDLVESEFYRTV